MNNSNLSQVLIGVTTVFVIIGSIIYFNLPKNDKKNSNSSSSSSSSNSSNSNSKNEKRTRSPSNLEDKYPAGKMSIYFASQTGTAEGFARTIMAESHKSGFDAKMIDLEDFDPEQVRTTRLAVFLVATYGEGDPTDNSAKFYKWLKNEDNSLPSDYLSPLQFTVFGLGNSQYENFNKMGREFNQKLADLGAERVFDYGEGDDDATLEDDFENWKVKAIPALTKRYRPSSSIPPNVDDSSDSAKAPLTYEVEKCNPVNHPKELPQSLISTTSKYFFSSHYVTVTKNREMRTPADGGHTVHMEFDLTDSNVKYFTADNLAVIPDNLESSVHQFSQTCGGFDLDQYVSIIPVSLPEGDEEVIPFKHPFPNPCSLREIFTLYLDIDSIPRKSALERFIPYVTDVKQQNWLKELVSKDNREKFTHSIEQEGRTYTSLFSNELSSLNVPLADLFHLIPLIQPRYYTISSSSSVYPNSVHLTVSVVERVTPSGTTVKGLCSSFLYNMSVNSKSRCRIFSRESLFRLPEDLHTPIIMIGPGSGIAPMRALLQEREYQAKKLGIPFNEMINILYFGCKGRNFDYIYREELEDSLERGVLTSLKLAFSREQAKKVYVQNLMSEPENAKELVSLIDKGAHIFVCGGTGMGTTVSEVFTQIIAQEKGISHDEAAAIIKAKHKNKSYKQELWSV